MSANDPAIICPKMDPKRAAEATVPSNICIVPEWFMERNFLCSVGCN